MQAPASSLPARASGSHRTDLALLVLRIVVGLVFAIHGGQKLFAYGFGGVIGSFGKMGIPIPALTGPVVTLVEFLGGLALILGVVTRWAALLIAIDMVGAILFVHIGKGFFSQNGGFEYPLSLLAATVALALAGGGAYSLDARMSRPKSAP